MRYKRSKLLKNVSLKQLREYQNEKGFHLCSFSKDEFTMDEMISELYTFLTYSGSMMNSQPMEPTFYLNTLDTRKRVIMDLTRCLVTAKKLGEEIKTGGSPENIFDYLIRDLSQNVRCLKEKVVPSDFGQAFYDAAINLYFEYCTLIRRLKVTRQGYNSIKPLPGTVLSDSSKTVSSEHFSENHAMNNENSVCPEHSVASLPITVIQPTEVKIMDSCETESSHNESKNMETQDSDGETDENSSNEITVSEIESDEQIDAKKNEQKEKPKSNDDSETNDSVPEISIEEMIHPDEGFDSDMQLFEDIYQDHDPLKLRACISELFLMAQPQAEKT